MISVNGIDTFSLEILFSKLKEEVLSTSLVGTSFFSGLSFGMLIWFTFSFVGISFAEVGLLVIGSTLSLPFFDVAEISSLDTGTSLLFWMGFMGTFLPLRDNWCY